MLLSLKNVDTCAAYDCKFNIKVQEDILCIRQECNCMQQTAAPTTSAVSLPLLSITEKWFTTDTYTTTTHIRI